MSTGPLTRHQANQQVQAANVESARTAQSGTSSTAANSSQSSTASVSGVGLPADWANQLQQVVSKTVQESLRPLEQRLGRLEQPDLSGLQSRPPPAAAASNLFTAVGAAVGQSATALRASSSSSEAKAPAAQPPPDDDDNGNNDGGDEDEPPGQPATAVSMWADIYNNATRFHASMTARAQQRSWNDHRNLHEARALATTIDYLVANNTEMALEVLCRRFALLEKVDSGYSWDIAEHLDLSAINDELIGPTAMEAIFRRTARSQKIARNQRSRKYNRGSGGSSNYGGNGSNSGSSNNNGNNNGGNRRQRPAGGAAQ